MNEDTKYSVSWLQILDSINLEIMRSNEHELGTSEAVVNFETMGQFPERIGGLFAALREGLKSAQVDIKGVTLLILPYRIEAGTTEPLIVLWSGAKGSRWASKFVGDDKRACEKAVDAACREANVKNSGPEAHVVQVPYFVKAPGAEYTGQAYPVESLVFRNPYRYHTESPESCVWINSHSGSDYVQRFLFTFVCNAPENAIREVFFADEGAYISHLIGAFFSWVGVAADEVTRFQVERIASFQLLRSHQLGNKLAEIFFKFERENLEVLDEEGRNPTPESIKKIRRVLNDHRRDIEDLRDKVGQFSQVASTFGAKRSEFNWYAEFVHILETLGARSADDGLTYSVEGSTRWSSATLFDLSGIERETKNAHITFSKYHFPELIENLYKNAKRVWELPQNEFSRKNQPYQTFRVISKLTNGNMELAFANQGPEISDSLRTRLFRQPVPKEAQASAGNGIGLWALGMAFSTFGLPLPRVENIPEFGPSFIFTFPAKVKR
jgi:hypothetical protein